MAATVVAMAAAAAVIQEIRQVNLAQETLPQEIPRVILIQVLAPMTLPYVSRSHKIRSPAPTGLVSTVSQRTPRSVWLLGRAIAAPGT